MTHIYLKSDEIWNFCMASRNQLEAKLVVVAESDNSGGYKVFLTERGGLQQLLLSNKNKIIDGEWITSKDHCEHLLTKYLEVVNGDDESDLGQLYKYIEKRESELIDSLQNFIADMVNLGEDECGLIELEFVSPRDILDDIEELLYRKYGIFAYRPRVIEKDDNLYLLDSVYSDEEDAIW